MKNKDKEEKNRRGLAPILGLILAVALTACPQSGGDDSEPEPEPDLVLPPAITDLTLAQVSGENSFTASWKPESSPEGLTYELYYTAVSGTQGEAPLAPPSAAASGFPTDKPELKVSSGLKGGGAYTAWARAVLDREKGPWSEGASITLKKDQTGLTFSIEVFGETRFGKIQGNTIQVQVPINTAKPWRFTPQIALSEGASLISQPEIGAEADFSDPDNPVHYQVQAENERIQDYTVSMSRGDESGLGFSLDPEALLSLQTPLSLSISKNQTKALILDQEYQDCTWYVDGLLKGRNSSLRLYATNYKPGIHYLSVNGFKRYGEDLVPWSTELEFTVTE